MPWPSSSPSASSGVLTVFLKGLGIDPYANGFTIYSKIGLELVYLYFQFPLMVLIIAPAIDGLRPEWREAAENMGASSFQYWRRVALPILFPTILGTMILLFGNAFGAQATAYQLTGGPLPIVPVIIGAQISGDVLHNPGLGYAMAMGMVVIMATARIIVLHGPAAAGGALAPMKRRRTRMSSLALVARLPARRPVLLPAAATPRSSSRCEAKPAVRGVHEFASPTRSSSRACSTRSWSGSSRSSSASRSSCPTAYWVQLRVPRARPVVEFVTLLPFVIPPVVLVFGLIRVYSRPAVPLTHTDIGSTRLLVFGYVVLSLPYMYRAVDTGLRSIDVRSLTEAAQSMGAGWFTILWRIILPNLRVALLSGAFLTLAIVLGEFTIASFLARPAFGPYLTLLSQTRPTSRRPCR